MPSRRACLVLGIGLGSLLHPAMAASAWLLWQIQSRPRAR